ncbi:hypothetical protein GQ457_03G022620 [Hibiscus cannabinus]
MVNSEEVDIHSNSANTSLNTGSINSRRIFSSNKINVTLDDNNYMLWNQQVLLTIKTNRLQKFIDSNVTWPPQYVTKDGVASINPDFKLYEEHDGALASWLLSTVSCIVVTTSRLMSFRRMLHSQKKGDLSMREFLMKIKSICDNLANCGEVISDQKHVTAILNGLTSEYESVITARPTPSDVKTMCTILLDVDSRRTGLLNQISASAHVFVQQQPHVVFQQQSDKNYTRKLTSL